MLSRTLQSRLDKTINFPKNLQGSFFYTFVWVTPNPMWSLIVLCIGLFCGAHHIHMCSLAFSWRFKRAFLQILDCLWSSSLSSSVLQFLTVVASSDSSICFYGLVRLLCFCWIQQKAKDNCRAHFLYFLSLKNDSPILPGWKQLFHLFFCSFLVTVGRLIQ